LDQNFGPGFVWLADNDRRTATFGAETDTSFDGIDTIGRLNAETKQQSKKRLPREF
jgi:hypothetical protein